MQGSSAHPADRPSDRRDAVPDRALGALAGTVPETGMALPDVAALERFATDLAHALDMELAHRSLVLSLVGDLGAGKTTLARALLQTLGERGRIKSPTYTLFETYRIADREVAHVDLYRVVDPEELELIGFDELVAHSDLVLVEWACNGGRWMPVPDLTLSLQVPVEGGRRLFLDLRATSSTL